MFCYHWQNSRSLEEMSNMRITILPKTAFGWWSIVLLVALFFLGFAAEGIIGPEGIGRYPTVLRAGVVWALVAMAAASVVTGLYGILRKKNGAILVFVSTALGLAFTVLLIVAAVQTMMGLA
jgi:hypothetical protein